MISRLYLLVLSLGIINKVRCHEYEVADSLVHAKGRCVTYGFSENKVHYNVYNGEPKEITDSQAISIMKDFCPAFQNQPVCCDSTQIKNLADKIKIAANLLKECASCWANFKMILCQQMCSPDQSTFMEIPEQFHTPAGSLAARSFRTSLTKEYAVKFFDSCKEVTSFGLSAIGMICADMDCTYHRLLKELGDNTSRAPYHTDYYVGNSRTDMITPLKADVLTHCWESTLEGEEACTCDDCSESCRNEEMVTAPPPNEEMVITAPPPNEPCNCSYIYNCSYISVVVYISLLI